MNSQWQKSLKIWYLPHPKSKTCDTNFIKSCYGDLSNNIPMTDPNSSYLKWMVNLQMRRRHSQLMSPSKTWSLWLIWIFDDKNHLKINISPHPKSKSYETYIFHQLLLLKIFPTTPKAHPNSSEIFQLWFILTFSQKSIQEFKNFYTTSRKIMKPSWCTSPCQRFFQRYQEHDLKHPWFDESHCYKTKQNKTNYLPS
jgi:hypothetical protein